MASECIVCGKPAHIGIGGAMFCPIHAAEAREDCDRQRAEGDGVGADVMRYAVSARRRIATSINLSGEAIAVATRLAEERGLSRSRLIETLILEAGKTPVQP